ncbi:hypothetical protein SAMN05518672_10846 [Chitinophaga sp. CF118]|uniref:hypothetical protein n=1 Tax=Chitinophaga sp. CF118 TaxID=1884367 RepID=UPI0008EDE821|nr:hypothetical protein [Chitinophaga sp. CF118]SFE59541.1 hypothetical protein SAMN05518672_10846 [Chitinophaga sp. CF118]
MSFGIKQAAIGIFYCMTTFCVTRLHSQNKVNTDKEWELFKFERYEKKLKFSMDSLKLIYRHRWSVGFSFGGLYMPGYTSAEKDYKTGVNMRSKHSFYMLSLEYYITNITRVGIEAGWQKLPQKIEFDQNSTYIKGGGGMNIPVLAYMKRDLFGGVMNKTAEELKGGQANNRPSFFIMAAAGLTFTNLVRVRGNQSEIAVSLYKQTPFTSKLGFGIFQCIGRVIGAEFISGYQISSNYSPYIGSVSSHSGFSFAARFSFMGNGKFNKVKRYIDSIY